MAATKVSKRSKGISAILDACFPGWGGRRIFVVEAAPEWVRIAGRGEQVTVWQVDLATTWPSSMESFTTPAQPAPHGNPIPSHIPQGCALLIHSRIIIDMNPYWSGKDLGIEIVIPAGSIDAAAIQAAADAIEDGNKRAAAEILAACGDFAGIASALVEAQTNARGKALAKAA